MVEVFALVRLERFRHCKEISVILELLESFLVFPWRAPTRGNEIGCTGAELDHRLPPLFLFDVFI